MNSCLFFNDLYYFVSIQERSASRPSRQPRRSVTHSHRSLEAERTFQCLIPCAIDQVRHNVVLIHECNTEAMFQT